MTRSLRAEAMTKRRQVKSSGTQPVTVRRSWTITSDIAHIGGVVDAVTSFCVAAGFSSRVCRLNVPVALTEALSNAIISGNGSDPTREVRILAAMEAESLLLEVTDEGDGFDVDLVRQSPNDSDWLERESGRGLYLMRALMDHVESRREPAPRGHTVQLRLRRA